MHRTRRIETMKRDRRKYGGILLFMLNQSWNLYQYTMMHQNLCRRINNMLSWVIILEPMSLLTSQLKFHFYRFPQSRRITRYTVTDISTISSFRIWQDCCRSWTGKHKTIDRNSNRSRGCNSSLSTTAGDGQSGWVSQWWWCWWLVIPYSSHTFNIVHVRRTDWSTTFLNRWICDWWWWICPSCTFVDCGQITFSFGLVGWTQIQLHDAWWPLEKCTDTSF